LAGSSIIFSIERRSASAFAIPALEASSSNMPVVSLTVVSDTTAQCDTSSARVPA
jgi:hypothetical protein